MHISFLSNLNQNSPNYDFRQLKHFSEKNYWQRTGIAKTEICQFMDNTDCLYDFCIMSIGWRSNKPIGKQAEFWKCGQVSQKIFGYPYFKLPPGGPVGALRARRGFAAITGPLFPDYIPQRMRGMAMDSGLLRPVPTRCLKIDAFLFLWCIGIHYAL